MPEAGSVQGVTLSRDQISWSLEGATALPVTDTIVFKKISGR
jgi:hypothetical protein